MTAPAPIPGPTLARALRWTGLTLTAVLCLAPYVLEPRPAAFLGPDDAWLPGLAGKVLVAGLMAAALAVRAWADRREGREGVGLTISLAVAAAALTLVHWHGVDQRWIPDDRPTSNDRAARDERAYLQETHRAGRHYYAEAWQREHYLAVLNHKPGGTPHTYRPLPYGFARLSERLTGDWSFACVSYRWFFTYWFLWAYYGFVRRYLPPRRAALALVPYLLLYPLSVWYYLGQLTDPLSHALFALALTYTVENDVAALAVALALGVMAKETVVIMVPAYWACYWRKGWPAVARAAVLGLACVVAFLAVRLPWGWTLRLASINNTNQLMIGPNLGIGQSNYVGMAKLFQNYLHPVLFIVIFLPFIVRHWRDADRRVKSLTLVLTPLLLLSNLCFGWLYESRNYVPLLPLLTTLALWPPRKNDPLDRTAGESPLPIPRTSQRT